MKDVLNIETIKIDGGTQARLKIDEDVVADYADAMERGEGLPPLVVFYDGSDYWLADGFHRYDAHAQCECDDIEVEVKNGTRRDAILYAVGANTSHGLRRSNADKRRAIEILINDEEWGQWSDYKVAKYAGVGNSTVSMARRDKIVAAEKAADGVARGGRRPNTGGKKKQPISPNPTKTAPPVQSGPKSASLSIKDSEDSGQNTPNSNGPPPPERRKYITKHGTVATMDVSRIGKGKAPPPPPEQPRPLDGFGRPVSHGGLATAIRKQDQLDEIASDIRAARKKIKTLAESGNPLGAFLKVQQAQADLKNAATAIRFAKPYALCPYCGGKQGGCQPCHSQGWVPKEVFECAPKDMQEAISKC